jgi:hypothetical protein
MRGDAQGAVILGAAAARLERAALVWDPAEQPEYDATLTLARRVAGERCDDLVAECADADPRSF